MNKNIINGSVYVINPNGDISELGEGFFNKEERKVIIRVRENKSAFPDIKHIDKNDHLLLKEDGGKIYLTVHRLKERDDFFGDLLPKIRTCFFGDYIECSSLEEAKRILAEGVKNIFISVLAPVDLSALDSKKQKTLCGSDIEVRVGNQTVKETISSISFRITIAFILKNNIKIDTICRLFEVLSIYWMIWQQSRSFIIKNVSVATEKDGVLVCSPCCIDTKQWEIRADDILGLVDFENVDLNIIVKLAEAFLQDEKENYYSKLAVSLVKYCEIKQGATIIEAGWKIATAFDSLATYETKGEKIDEIKKRKIIKDIRAIQDIIKNNDNLSDEVKKFYCDKESERVYDAMRHRPFSELVESLANRANINLSKAEKNAIKKLHKTRRAIIHGEKYNLDKMIDNSTCTQVIVYDAKNNSIDYRVEEGYIISCIKLYEKIIKSLF